MRYRSERNGLRLFFQDQGEEACLKFTTISFQGLRKDQVWAEFAKTSDVLAVTFLHNFVSLSLRDAVFSSNRILPIIGEKCLFLKHLDLAFCHLGTVLADCGAIYLGPLVDFPCLKP